MKKKKATLHTHNSAPTENVRPWHCQSSRTRLCRRPHSSWRDATRERRRWPVGCQIINMSSWQATMGGRNGRRWWVVFSLVVLIAHIRPISSVNRSVTEGMPERPTRGIPTRGRLPSNPMTQEQKRRLASTAVWWKRWTRKSGLDLSPIFQAVCQDRCESRLVLNNKNIQQKLYKFMHIIFPIGRRGERRRRDKATRRRPFPRLVKVRGKVAFSLHHLSCFFLFVVVHTRFDSHNNNNNNKKHRQ